MSEYIKKLQQLPQYKRTRIAISVSALVTSFIFVVWVSVVFPTITITSGGNQVVAQKTESSLPPFSAIKSNLANIYNSFYEDGTVDLLSSEADEGEVSATQKAYEPRIGEIIIE